MRLEDGIPGPRYFAIILPAGLLPLGRHLGLIGEALEPRRVGTNHQANNMKRTLLAYAVLAVINRLRPCLLIATRSEEPVFRCFGEHALGKVAADPKQSKRRKRIGLVLLPSEHRQFHLVNGDVAHFVEQRKERIAHDEFQPIEALLLGEVLEARVVLECSGKLLYALVKCLAEPTQPVERRQIRSRAAVGSPRCTEPNDVDMSFRIPRSKVVI